MTCSTRNMPEALDQSGSGLEVLPGTAGSSYEL